MFFLRKGNRLKHLAKALKKLKKYRNLVFALLIISIAALIQSTVLDYFRIFNIKPDIILATLIIFALFFELRWACITAFLGGGLVDLLGNLPFGFNTPIYILWAILANWIARKLTMENSFIRSSALFIIVLLNNLVTRFLFLLLGRPLLRPDEFLSSAIFEGIYTILIAYPLFRLYFRIVLRKNPV